jgi:hypothetical protein
MGHQAHRTSRVETDLCRLINSANSNRKKGTGALFVIAEKSYHSVFKTVNLCCLFFPKLVLYLFFCCDAGAMTSDSWWGTGITEQSSVLFCCTRLHCVLFRPKIQAFVRKNRIHYQRSYLCSGAAHPEDCCEHVGA